VDLTPDAGLAVDSIALLSGDESFLESRSREVLLSDVLRSADSGVWEVPVLYDPFGFLGGEFREYYAEDGWIVVMKRYGATLPTR
jgi:hypothetical protein